MATTMALGSVSSAFCSKFFFATRLSTCAALKVGSINTEQRSFKDISVQPQRFLWAGTTFSTPKHEQSSSENRKPKYPQNVFIMYLQRVQDQIQKENPNAIRKEVVAIASQKWKTVDPETKSKLAMQRKELFEKYKNEKQYYVDNMTPEQMRLEETKKQRKLTKKLKLARRQLGMPKSPASPFCCFMAERYSEHAGEDAVAKVFKKVIEQWRSLDEQQKEVYKQQSAKRSEIYKEEMERWEKEMMELGRFDVIRKSTLLRLAMANNPKRNLKKDEEQL